MDEYEQCLLCQNEPEILEIERRRLEEVERDRAMRAQRRQDVLRRFVFPVTSPEAEAQVNFDERAQYGTPSLQFTYILDWLCDERTFEINIWRTCINLKCVNYLLIIAKQ